MHGSNSTAPGEAGPGASSEGKHPQQQTSGVPLLLFAIVSTLVLCCCFGMCNMCRRWQARRAEAARRAAVPPWRRDGRAAREVYNPLVLQAALVPQHRRGSGDGGLTWGVVRGIPLAVPWPPVLGTPAPRPEE